MLVSAKIQAKHMQNVDKNDVQKVDSYDVQSGGAIMTPDSFDYKRLAISNYVKIDWGWSPGPPPMDCNIM